MRRKKGVKNSLPAGDEVTASESEALPECGIDELLVERPKFICAICKKSFSDKNCLKKHIKKIHDVEPEPLLSSKDFWYLILKQLLRLFFNLYFLI